MCGCVNAEALADPDKRSDDQEREGDVQQPAGGDAVVQFGKAV